MASFCALALFARARPASAQPVAASVERPASSVRLVRVAGRVEVAVGDGRTFAPAVADTWLSRGSRLRTGDDGVAELAWTDGVTLLLEAQSLLTLFGNSAPAVPGMPPSTTTTLHRGTLHLSAAPNGPRSEPMPLATTALTMFPGRADATLAAELGGHITRVAVTRGRVRVRFGTTEYIVPTQNAVREEMGRPPALMRLLPRPPEWRRAPSSHAVSFGEPVDVEGTFAPNHRPPTLFPITGWRLEVARDEGFHERASETRLDVRETRVRLRSLAPGTWFARLFAVDAEHFESSPSAPVRIEIAAPRVDPGALPTATQPGHRATLVIPPRFFCSLDGSPWMNEGRPMPLDPGRRYALRCGVSSDGHDARETSLDADRVGPLVHTVRLGAPVASRTGDLAAGTISLSLHDAEGRPVSLASIDVAAEDGVSADAMRETETRGTYSAGIRLPRGLRTARLRFTVNHALTLEESVDVPNAIVSEPAVTTRAAPPAAVQVQVIRSAQPFRRPDEDDPRPDEEP